MPATGRQLNVKQALALCYHVGFRANRLTTAVAVMSNESARYIGSYGLNRDADGNVISIDRGLFQINTLHKTLSDEEAFCPVPNAEYAYRLSQRGSDFSPWMAYTSGNYLRSWPYTKFIQVTKKDEWMAIDVERRIAEWCAAIPDDVVDFRLDI